MTKLSPEKIWGLSESELFNLLDTGNLIPRARKIRFYSPSFAYHKAKHDCSSQAKFPTISVTGNACALDCKHCGGKVLGTMLPAETPAKLFEIAEKIKREGAVGCLISGGCLPNGSVPLQQFIPVIGRIKRELGLTVVVHTGFVNTGTAEALKEVEVDAALIDVIGSNETIKQACNLNVTINDYEDSLKALRSAGLNFVPHVIVGLHNGMLKGEFQALRMIKRFDPSALVVIAFMPIRGTQMENVKPPTPTAIARVIASARVMLPETPLALGCMRPKGKHRAETDILTLKAGADAIAFPSEESIMYAESHGMEVNYSPCCCSQIYVDLGVRSGSK